MLDVGDHRADEGVVTDGGLSDTVGEHDDAVAALSAATAGKRRFTVAAVIGTAVMAVPYLWILWGAWESPDPIRKTVFEDNFFDVQARALFHGHLYLPKGAIGIEAFVHAGHQYTYFGLFPSIIRMPILLVTSRLDGHLTAPFMLAAWVATAVFAALLLWRVRVLVRGDAVVSRTEATGYGVLMATIMGGSVLLYLAATPYVFSEDLAWSVCLTVGSLFALLGVMERPTWGRVVASGVLILCANLDRATTGYASAGAALLVACWFFFGRGGRDSRRWWLPVALAGAIPLLVAVVVNMIKFDLPFGVPVSEQVWSSINVHRQHFLAAHHNSEVGLDFVPSTAWAYFQPLGLRFTSTFPFMTMPAQPAASFSGVIFDRLYRTDSVPASTPLLFLLSCWGLITAFRPRSVGKVARTRLLLLAAGAACVALLLWGYIAPRYLADFMPLLILASAVAMADIWRRLDGKRRGVRIGSVVTIGVVGLFSIAANFGATITPNDSSNDSQVANYVSFQHDVSQLVGGNFGKHVSRGSELPAYAPGDQLFIVGNCDGLYISNGESYSTVPSQQYERQTWVPVERGPNFERTFDITFNRLHSGPDATVPLVSSTRTSLLVSVLPYRGTRAWVVFSMHGPGRRSSYGQTKVASGSTLRVTVITDSAMHVADISVDGSDVFSAPLSDPGPFSPDTQRSTTGGTPAGPVGHEHDVVIAASALCQPEPLSCRGPGGRKIRSARHAAPTGCSVGCRARFAGRGWR